MATWEISTEYKKSSIERQFWSKGDKVIIREEGYRWGTFTVESDTMPITMEELRNEDNDFELGVIDNDNMWELVDLVDGCWADTEKGRNCTDEDLEEFENAWEENYYEGVEELGWSNDDTEYYMTGPLKLTNVDTGEEFLGSTDPATIVHTIELSTEEVAPALAPIVDEGAKWPFATAPVEEVEEVEGFTNLTDWYSAEHYHPTNKGRYQVNSYDAPNWPFPTFAEWNGKKWSENVISWRGLASDPGVK